MLSNIKNNLMCKYENMILFTKYGNFSNKLLEKQLTLNYGSWLLSSIYIGSALVNIKDICQTWLESHIW